MAASDIQNPPAPAETKSAKKKLKAKAERNESPAPAASTPERAGSAAGGEIQEDSDNVYIRDLQKSIRNITKKITNTAKIDAIIAEHGSKSLDELVSLKIINPDQKAAHLKKPALQAQLFQLEEQLAQHKKIDQEYRVRLAEQEKALTDKFEKEKADAAAEITEKAVADTASSLRSNLLILSQFLRLAAARRAEDADSTSDESMALEGVLLHIYSGDENAVATMLKLVQGAEEPTRSTTGETLQTTFAEVKQLAIAQGLFTAAPAESTTTESEPSSTVESTQPPQTDPTLANAALTEVDDGSATPLTNGHSHSHTQPLPQEAGAAGALGNADVANEAANAAAVENTTTTGPESPTTDLLSASQEGWVDVKIPREPGETETGLAGTPAGPGNTQSWADDHPEVGGEGAAGAGAGAAVGGGNGGSGVGGNGTGVGVRGGGNGGNGGNGGAAADDGFQSVQGRQRGHREGGGEGGGRGGWRGRGGYRGRGGGGGGFRGEGGRGRGRGGGRGGPGGPSRGRRGGGGGGGGGAGGEEQAQQQQQQQQH